MSDLQICTEDTTLTTNAEYMLLYFTASFCPPCQKIGPFVTRLSEDPNYHKIKFFKIDIQSCPSLTNTYNISSVPTFILIRKGEPDQIVETMTGADDSRLQALLSSTNKIF